MDSSSMSFAENLEQMSLSDVQSKMAEYGAPDCVYARGKNKGKIHTNKKQTIKHFLRWISENSNKSSSSIPAERQTEPIPASANKKMTSEDLREMIHDIHNFLRNSGIGYGMSALKIFNLLYGMKKIEKFDLFDKIELDRECKFSSLVSIARDGERLCHVFNIEYLQHIHESIIQNFLMEELPDHIKEKDLRYLILEIDNLVEMEYGIGEQLSGKIYEYFIGRDESAISELGAYFTNRLIVDYIYDFVKPELDANGEVQTMIDPFGGSGGFTGGYIQYLQKTHAPDWKTGLKNVFHVDMNNDVVKYAGMEFMCLTQEVPEIGIHLRCENSFTFEFDGNKLFQYIFTNPPYGGDKNSKYGKRLANDTLLKHLKSLAKPINDLIDNNRKASKGNKKFEHIDIPKDQLLLGEKYNRQIKKCLAIERMYRKKFDSAKVSLENSSNFIQRYAHKHDLKANDKEGVSLILMMALLAPGGTAVGVLKEGVFFNSVYKSLRKHLLNNFEVSTVISVPQDQFENTSTKTSIIIFKRHVDDIATSQVKFRKLDVVKYKENEFEWDDTVGEFSLAGSAGEVYDLEDPIIASATFEEIEDKEWCLDGKKYNVKQLVPGDGFKMVRLGDIIKFLPKSKRKASYGKSEGKYPFYASSDKVKWCDTADYTEQSLIVGDGGSANLQIDQNFTCSDHNHVITVTQSCSNEYVYFILKGNMTLLERGFTGSVLKNLSKTYLKNLHIPIPIDPEVTKMWVDKISGCDTKKQFEKLVKELGTTALKNEF